MNLLVEQVLIKENSATLQGLKDMLYEVRCLKSNEDMILALAVQQVRGSYLHLTSAFDI